MAGGVTYVCMVFKLTDNDPFCGNFLSLLEKTRIRSTGFKTGFKPVLFNLCHAISTVSIAIYIKRSLIRGTY